MELKTEVITRKQAKEQGLPRYFTGKPCKKGHVDVRLVSNGQCCSCRMDRYIKERLSFNSNYFTDKECRNSVKEIKKLAKEQNNKYYFTGIPCEKGHIAQRLVRNNYCILCFDDYLIRNNENIIKSKDKWTKNNKDKIKLKNEKYLKENPDKRKETQSKYYKANKNAINAKNRNRQLAKIFRTPKWADLQAIKEFYINCPKDMTVDHIIPLQGKLVSGLHVLANLQYLTPKENFSKGNKYKVD